MKDLRIKIEDAIHGSGCDAVMTFGADNFSYLSGAVPPFAEYYPEKVFALLMPLDGIPVVICPFDWSDAVKDQGWKGDIQTYNENEAAEHGPFVYTLTTVVKELELENKRLGFDTSRITKGLATSISKAIPKAKWESIDPMLKELRIVKTKKEIELIETACKHVDKGIVHALMHLEGTIKNPGYTVAEFTERIRVHINENGASGVALVHTCFGDHARVYYTPQKGWVKDKQLFRMEVSNNYMGRWCNLGRMGVTSRPTSVQESAYQQNLSLKEDVVEMLKPGVSCNEVYSTIVKKAMREGIGLWKEIGIGHGVGASHYESPYLNAECSSKLRTGMVLALDLYTYGPNKELVHNKDVYVITKKGAKKLSWYRNWDRLYAITGFRSTH
jgi:Xaa-Pro aminopeptidase